MKKYILKILIILINRSADIQIKFDLFILKYYLTITFAIYDPVVVLESAPTTTPPLNWTAIIVVYFYQNHI